MPSPFHGIELASRALRAFQRSLDVTGHNIANVNTRGYTRQVADLSTTDPVTYWQNGARTLGTGVTIGSINRIRDLFLEGRMQSSLSQSNQYSTVSGSVKQILGLMNEPGANGITSALGKFFDSWSSLASNPNDPSTRMQVQQAAKTLTGRVRETYATLKSTSDDMLSEASSTIMTINNLATSIADMNTHIREQIASGGTPNDLMDQRDQAIRDLSQLVNVSTTQNSDGTLNVISSEFTLVDQSGARTMPSTIDLTTGKITGWTVPIDVRSGKLAGQIQAMQIAKREMGNLDTLANTLRTQVNAQHQTAVSPYGTTGANFFNDSATQTGAVDFDLDPQIATDYMNIAAGVGDIVGPAHNYVVGDTGVALMISKLRDLKIGALSNRTFTDFQKDNVNRLGSDQSYFESAANTQDAILQQVDQQQQAVSGVNLDEEMSNMLRFQRSYQAAAKVLSIFDQVTDDLIRMVNR